MMIVQMIGGYVAHAKRDPTRTVRPFVNQMHRFVGAATVLLGWTNICFGVYDHPTWPANVKRALIILYFLVVLLVFGRSELLLGRQTHQQLNNS